MDSIKLEMMKGMVSILNEASEAYYNSDKPIMSDEQFDARLEDLKQLEEETGFVLANSPTHNVGAKVLTELKEITHSHPMLSLEKCHTSEEIIKFANNKELIASIKLDGLTCSLTYKDGDFVSAETRGNGYVGSDITEHVKQFKNVPLKINKKGTYTVDGEAIIADEDFAEVNKDGEYKNSRNLASGTLSVLDTSFVSKRKLRFIAWDVIDGGSNSLKDNLNEAKELGFDVVPFWYAISLDPKKLQNTIDYVFEYAKDEGLPCDGIVFKFNNIEYGKSLGATSHHFKNGIAYKAKDDVYETKLVDVEFTMGKTGVLTPTAVFEPVEIDGTIVSRASLHNISILTSLDLHKGDTIEVKKCNQIIPQIHRNVSSDERAALGKESDYIIIPSTCPICGGNTEIRQDNDSKVLVCTNNNCKGKLLGKLTHFVSKNAMDIDGMSEATLEKFIELGWLNSFEDIYNLKTHADEMVELDGFGETSVKKLLDAIEASRNTTVDRFLYAISINLIGKSASKDIAQSVNGDIRQFVDIMNLKGENAFIDLHGFGKEMCKSLAYWWVNNKEAFYRLARELNFIEKDNSNNRNKLNDKIFVITGSLVHYKNRDELISVIESMGGKVSSSVSAKTDYLINNDVNSNSSKNQKAQKLNIPIISEINFIKMIEDES